MASLRITIDPPPPPPPPPPETPEAMAPGEVDHHVYTTEVLRLDSGITEDAVDAELVARANSLGIAASTLQKRNTCSAFSSSTLSSGLDQTFSRVSTPMVNTPHSSVYGRSSTDLPCTGVSGFGLYDQFISALDGSLEQMRGRKGSLPAINSSAQSVFSVNTNKSFSSVRLGFKPRSWWKKKSDKTVSCHGCRSPPGKMMGLHDLSCNHTYCSECLRYLVGQACADEASMPPRCCSRPFPSRTLQDALDRDTQQSFLKAVAHFSTPKNARIYCPNSKCGEFINPHQVVDHKHPFDVTCHNCLTRACRMCKQSAHAIGVDCPQDWELEAVKKMGQSASWKRCYACHSLVSLARGRTHMACRCKEELCPICGGVWDTTTGCPNLCGDEGELEKRRSGIDSLCGDGSQNEPAERAAAAAREQAEKREAEKRARRSPEVQELMRRQTQELHRFTLFAARTRTAMHTRHDAGERALAQSHAAEEAAMRDRHCRAASSLEDRQIAAEMELRASLEQTERSVKLRLKHMEAYCQRRKPSGGGGGGDAGDSSNRVVTEKNLKELGQQYSLRDGMQRQHQAKINVMRDRQAKRMEELLERQDAEADALADRHREAEEARAALCAADKENAADTLRMLQIRLTARWSLQVDVLCRELEVAEGLRYGPVATPAWPQDQLPVRQAAQ